MSNNLKPVQNLSPFTKFCCSIGAIPSSYLVSLTYEEQLIWLCDYLQNTVIPAVNNNGDAVTELQNLYVQLKSYVNNYFDNLDVQQEINNKLDQMATDGTLNRIINQEIFGQINNDITNLKNNIYSNPYVYLNSDYFICIGDSYANGYTPDGAVTSWCDILAQRYNTSSYYKFASNGAGFQTGGSGGQTFLQILQNNINKVVNPNNVKKIIVAGGYNDANYNSDISGIQQKITEFNAYCLQHFPYAKVYIACIGYNISTTYAGSQIRDKLATTIIPAYSMTPNTTNPPIFLQNSNLVLHNKIYFSSDNFHPNLFGQHAIANKIFEGLEGTINISHGYGTCNIDLTSSTGHVNNISGSQTLSIVTTQLNHNIRLYLPENTNIIFTTPQTVIGNQNFQLGTFSHPYIFPTNNFSFRIPVDVLITSTSKGNKLINGLLIFTTTKEVMLRLKFLNENQWGSIPNVTQISLYAFGATIDADYN